jgi:hypothetical protein
MSRLIDADALREQLVWCKEQAGRYNDYWDDVIERLDSLPTVSGWISVKDRLPDTYKPVITYDKYSGVKENWLLKEKPCVNWSQGFHVTHWMPLPEPPKEETPDA